MTSKNQASPPPLFFFRQFLKSPRGVGSIIPTSAVAVRAALAPVDWSEVRCVVEYGPGTGVFTRALLDRMEPQARLVAIDTSADFIAYLRQSIDDPRLITVHGSAAQVEIILAGHGLPHADVVVSGLPFSTLPAEAAEAIMDATARTIRPGGAFLVYQYSRFVRSLLRARFARVDEARVWRCIPPLQLFHAWHTAR